MVEQTFPPAKVKDLGIKMGTKDERYWQSVVDQVEELIVKGRNDLIINKTLLKLAEKKLAKEKNTTEHKKFVEGVTRHMRE